MTNVTTLLEDLRNNNELQEPGQFKIYSCVLTTKAGVLNILSMIEGLNLYESIFNNFLTGDITILDRDNVLEEFHLSGTEPLYLEFGTKGSEHRIKVNLILSKIKNKEKINLHSIRYTLNLIPQEFLNNARVKISKSFEGNYSDMVRDIYTDYLSAGEPLWLEEVKSNNRLIIPNKSPIDAINMASQFAISSNTTNPDFLFFQSTKSFHFRSMAEMIYLDGIRPEGIVFRVEPSQPGVGAPIETRATRALNFEVKSDTDILKHTALGTYGSTLLKHDIRSKTWSTSTWGYHNQFEEDADQIKVNEFPLTPDGPVDEDGNNMSAFPDSYYNMVSGSGKYAYQITEGLNQFEKLNYKETLLQRKTSLNSMNIQRAQVSVPGISGLQAGDIIGIKVDGLHSENERLSGKWLIESVAHQVGEKYYCSLMIIRDSVKSHMMDYKPLNYRDSSPKVIIASPTGSSNKA